MAKKLISFELTSEGYVVAPLAPYYKNMTFTESKNLSDHLRFIAGIVDRKRKFLRKTKTTK